MDDRRAPTHMQDSDYVVSLNRAIREAAERSLCLRGSYNLDLTAGEGRYTIPLVGVRPESIVVQRVYVNGKPIAKGSAEQLEAWLEQHTTQQTPTTFAQRDQTLMLAPLPKTAITISLSGVWYPLAVMTMEDAHVEPELPPHVHDDLVHWLAYEAIMASDAGDTREERRTRLAERHLNAFERRFGPARSVREINGWRELPQERHVRGPGV